jgi:hypothetical protein
VLAIVQTTELVVEPVELVVERKKRSRTGFADVS